MQVLGLQGQQVHSSLHSPAQGPRDFPDVVNREPVDYPVFWHNGLEGSTQAHLHHVCQTLALFFQVIILWCVATRSSFSQMLVFLNMPVIRGHQTQHSPSSASLQTPLTMLLRQKGAQKDISLSCGCKLQGIKQSQSKIQINHTLTTHESNSCPGILTSHLDMLTQKKVDWHRYLSSPSFRWMGSHPLLYNCANKSWLEQALSRFNKGERVVVNTNSQAGPGGYILAFGAV